MTEAEWLAATDPTRMLDAVLCSSKASDRKLRLFVVACCRRVWHLLDERCRHPVEVAERFADGLASKRELAVARKAAWDRHPAGQPSWREDAAGYASEAAYICTLHYSFLLKAITGVLAFLEPPDEDGEPVLADMAELASRTADACCTAASPGFDRRDQGRYQAEQAAQVALLRDLFGPLRFRDIPLDPAWLAWNKGTIVRLAESAYEERALPAGTLDVGRLAVLADALEEAGCHDPDILGHLREPGGVHVRGCWVVDRLLGKE
jgi:hypothetical protein